MQLSKKAWLLIGGIGYSLLIIAIIGLFLSYNGQYVSTTSGDFTLLGIIGSALWAVGSIKYRQKLAKEKQDKQNAAKL